MAKIDKTIADADNDFFVEGRKSVEGVEFITSSHSYHDQTAFGGELFSWMDNLAAIAGMRYGRCKAVTASVDALYFLKPARVGMIIKLKARIIRVYNTSCHIQVTVKDLEENDAVAVGYFLMVSLDDNGSPKAWPPLTYVTDDEIKRAETALMLKENNRKLRTLLMNSFGITK